MVFGILNSYNAFCGLTIALDCNEATLKCTHSHYKSQLSLENIDFLFHSTLTHIHTSLKLPSSVKRDRCLKTNTIQGVQNTSPPSTHHHTIDRLRRYHTRLVLVVGLILCTFLHGWGFELR